MNKLVAGIALLSFPMFSQAEISIYSEALIGQSKQKMNSFSHLQGADKNVFSSSNSSSYGFRLGTKFSENFSLEISKHFHGSVDNKFTISYASQSPGIPGETPNEDITLQAKIPIEIDSTRIGIKVDNELFTNISVSARLGIAYWEYKENTPYPFVNEGESGKDLFYSVGAEYHLTENAYLGLEYSYFEASDKWDDRNSDNLGNSASFHHDVKDLSLLLGWIF